MYSSGALLRSQPCYQSTAALCELPAAGLTQHDTETAADVLGAWANSPRPPTPERLKPYQHYARQPPGTITRHFGSARDDVAQTHRPVVYGCRTKASRDTAAECLQSYPDSEIGRWKLEQAERNYASVRQAPLGRPPSRHLDMPPGMGTAIPCGRPLHVREQEAKNSTQDIIFPQAEAPAEAEELTHQLYVTSHSSFAAGEQRSRQYDWSGAKIDPATHRFGRVGPKGQQSIKQIMQPQLHDGQRTAPVVPEVWDRHKAMLGDALGRPRVLGAAPVSQLPPGHTFGRPSAREREPCVGELLRGCCSGAQQQQVEDPGLGQSMTRWRHSSAQPAPDRAFGLPSVRNDVPLPARPSVANTLNYGNEPTAGQLLAPPRCVDLGVKQEHLLQPRSRPEMLALLAAAGIGMEEDELEAVFGLAAAQEGCGGECCSLEGLMAARQLYLRHQAGIA